MKHSLNSEEKDRLDRRIAEAEKRTGAQIVLAVIERSDSYSELPWKAFALGTSLAGLLVLAMNILLPLNSATKAVLLSIVMMLAAGAGLALLCVFNPDFARLFLPDHRSDVETKQYAKSLFLERELFATGKRRAVLIMISLFERRIVVLPDKGLASQLHKEMADEIVQHMRMTLRSGQLVLALEGGLQKLEELIAGDATSTPSGNELTNAIIEEKGA